MTDTYFLIHALDADSAVEAQEALDGGYAIGADEVTIADDIVRPGEARLIGWPKWNDISDSVGAVPGSVLLAQITILGTPMHLGAIRVDMDGEQHAADEKAQELLEPVYAIYDIALETTAIEGYEGEYVVYATPHGA